MSPSSPGTRSALVLAVVAAAGAAVVALALLGWLPPCRVATAYGEQVRKSHLVATMNADLHLAAEAEKSAVLADTDRVSEEYAERARQAAAAVKRTRQELETLVGRGGVTAEASLLREFDACWTAFEAVDRELLPLAVQNTNLKASRLAAGEASEALERFAAALSTLVEQTRSSPESLAVARSCFDALRAAARIQTLEPAHIAEASSQRMDAFEAEMGACDRRAKAELERLDGLSGGASQNQVAAARSAYLELARVNQEILHLSRQNSNLRSLALSLGRKRAVTAQCEEVLAAFQAAVDRPQYPATR